MKLWTTGAAQKISMMLKVSVCESQDGAAAVRRARTNDEMGQISVKTSGCKSATVTAQVTVDRLYYAD